MSLLFAASNMVVIDLYTSSAGRDASTLLWIPVKQKITFIYKLFLPAT